MVETHGLTRCFGELCAVDRLDMTVRIGEVFGLLGPNGAGKSTVIRMLTTLLPPTAGWAAIAGHDVVKHATEVRRAIGTVPQLLSADGNLTGYENLLIFSKLYDVPRSERAARIGEALQLVELEEAAFRLVRTYSGGMIRRLEVAMAMLHRPRVLFLDEPTVGLDPMGRQAIWRHSRQMVRHYGTTIFLTTHLMEEADVLCDRIAIMNHGRVAAIGTPDELKGSVGRKDATLEEVFFHYTGNRLETEGNYREISRTRRNAARLG
jgi:ABC-2 type transport system ATP-binding protein